MTKAVLKNGVFQPIDPLPESWLEGSEVDVQLAVPTLSGAELDEWKKAMDKAAAEIDPEDVDELLDKIAEIRNHSKELARQGRL